MKTTKKIIEDYKSGDILINEATLLLREERRKAEEIIKAVKDFEYENLENYEKGTYKGFDFNIVNGRKKYDFTNCHSVQKAEEGLKKEERIAKAAFEIYQKTGEKPITEDGEIIELPEIKYGKSYLKITKCKEHK